MRAVRILLFVLAAAVVLIYGAVMIRDNFFIDKTPPEIAFDSDTIAVSVSDDSSALLAGVTARDDTDGDLTGQVMVRSVSQFVSDNTALVSYIVFDSADNMATASRNVTYNDYQPPHFALSEPLSFRVGSTVLLSDRLTASDVMDGDLSDSIRLISADLNTSIEGLNSVTVQVTNSMGDAATVELPVLFNAATTQDPEITLTDYLIYLPQGSYFDPAGYLDIVTDPAVGTTTVVNEDGEEVEVPSEDLRYAVTADSNVDTQVPGSYRVVYTYVNEKERSTSVALAVVVE